MKEIVIISGKGGTGKTSVAAALASVAQNIVIADCDVDAADMHLILKPKIKHSDNFYSGVKAKIETHLCVSCGECERICRFNAIIHTSGTYTVNPLDCEGCGYCYNICPAGAINLVEQLVGQYFLSDTKLGSKLAHAQLGIGADNSGKLVATVKKEAKISAVRNQIDYILVDGSPGIGCPVISSLSGADFVLLVTEPTRSGLCDLQRVWELTTTFKIPAGCIINKKDINLLISEEITQYLQKNGIYLVCSLPYDNDFSQAITTGQSLVEYNPSKWKQLFVNIWKTITKELI